MVIIFSEKSCGQLTDVAFTMNITTQGDNLYEDQITFTCITGYELNNGDLVRNCTSDGTWDGTAPSCHSMFFIKLFSLSIPAPILYR